ncbi:ribokinase-like isoform X2 [Carya illinoinensis]|uniref:ribokinase-like isoform X2 n=1 Tax=Carya illinoinensis TaxID=32201 RepID=UPI001C7279B1|nr:ribokinase-like isoform X2 [Carya illinoinensis]
MPSSNWFPCNASPSPCSSISRHYFIPIPALPTPATSTNSARNLRVKMASDSLTPPENRIVGCGSAVVDYLAAVAAYPKPDEKIRTTSLMVQGGGNAGNALTCVARLGLNPRLISKVADDTQGRDILDELKADGVDTSFFVVSKEGNSPFTYIIVDNQMKTRTCINTPGYPPMKPDDLSRASLLSALDGGRIFYSDGRLHETALILAQEAVRRRIPILIEAERVREGLDDLLKLADYAICSAKFPQAWTEAPSVPSALVSILLRLPNIKFVIVTLGEEGCIMLERSVGEGPQTEEIGVEILLESLKRQQDESVAIPTYISSVVYFPMNLKTLFLWRIGYFPPCNGSSVIYCGRKPVTRLRGNGIGTVCGRLLLGTAEKIPPSELIDTTGAGDAFIGAVVYALCTDMQPETMLPFAAQVAAGNCRALGARTGLPLRSDPRLASFLHQHSKVRVTSSAT